MATIPNNRIQEMLAAARAKKALAASTNNLQLNPIAQAVLIENSANSQHSAASGASEDSSHILNQYGKLIEYNAAQLAGIELAKQRKSFVITGSAGTGKTTLTKGAVAALIQECGIPPLGVINHRHLVDNSPGVVCIAYTRRAVQNIKKAMPEDLKANCITYHKLLAYAPVYYEIVDEVTGNTRNTMRFEPSYNASNPLPSSIHTIIIDEASMISIQQYQILMEAIGHNVQILYIGDIQQLQPVFGSSILDSMLVTLPVVELTEVHRQALESPIIRLLQRILSGVPIPAEQLDSWHIPEELKLHPWKKQLHEDTALLTAAKFLTSAIASGDYNPAEDIILMPFNKGFGTIELNKHIGNYLARHAGAVTYEVIAGFNKHYFSVGDKVMYEKEDAEVISIRENPNYVGKAYKEATTTLDYWGHEHAQGNHNTGKGGVFGMDSSLEDIDKYLENLAGDTEDRKTEASHILTIRLYNSDTEVEISSAAEINATIFGWALTVHKSQGSEWDKVFILLHKSHNTMLQRELLYTACSRAKSSLYVICEPDSFVKGINSQATKGNSLEEKKANILARLAKQEAQSSIDN